MLSTPQSVATEHRELHQMRASREAGRLGTAARELDEVLLPHFRREEEIATPPLGLLPALAIGNATAEMREVLPLTEALERELPQMLREHEIIRGAVKRFREAAEAANRPEYVRFSDDLAAHAGQEEEILYPAAVLVGRYVARTAPSRGPYSASSSRGRTLFGNHQRPSRPDRSLPLPLLRNITYFPARWCWRKA